MKELFNMIHPRREQSPTEKREQQEWLRKLLKEKQRSIVEEPPNRMMTREKINTR